MLEGINISRFKSNSGDCRLPWTHHLQHSHMLAGSCQRQKWPGWTIILIQYDSSLYSHLFINKLQRHACIYMPLQDSIKCELWLLVNQQVSILGGSFHGTAFKTDFPVMLLSLHIRLQYLMKAEAYVLSNSSQSGFSIYSFSRCDRQHNSPYSHLQRFFSNEL